MTLSDLKPLTKLPFNGVILPTITLSPEQHAQIGAKPDCSNYEFITQLCRNGFKEKIVPRIPKENRGEYVERVKMELETIESLGFTNYILMVWDICRFADEQGIPRGPGRGSVAGSLVAYLLDITELDPIENRLFFVRFLSKARAKSKVIDGVRYIDGSLVPDIDCDFSYFRRGEIIDYLNNRYLGQTSKLLTTTTFTSKILVKDVIKTYAGGTEQDAAEASDLIEKEFGVPQEIEEALSDDPKKANERFKQWATDHQEICDLAMDLSGLNRAEGQHASALLIAYKPIRELMPLQLTTTEGEKVEVSGFDMYSAQEIITKMDLLGLRTLDVIDQTCRMLGIKRKDIDVHHKSIYAYLQDFKNRYGIFQLETFAQGNAAAKVKPKNFEQLAACLAAARPGAYAQIDKLIAYTNEGAYNPVDLLIDDILKPTGGICLYQEQLLAMVNRLGMDLDECEALRRCISGDTCFVSKTRGWISINTLLKEGYKDDLFLVMTNNGVQEWGRIKDIWSNGLKTIHFVNSRNGLQVKATRNHQFLTEKGWKRVHHLKAKEDYLVCSREIEYDGVDYISIDLAILISGMLTEGYCSHHPMGGHFTNFNKEVMDKFLGAFVKVFNEMPHISSDYHVAYLKSRHALFLNKYMTWGLSRTKRIPEKMMGMTKETTRQFLAFMFTGEVGITLNSKQIEYSSASEVMIRQIQLLLLRFGIKSRLHEKIIKGYEHNGFYYRLYILGYRNQVKFYNEIGVLLCTDKKVILEKILEDKRVNTNSDSIPKYLVERFRWQYGHLISEKINDKSNRASGRWYGRSITRDVFSEFIIKSKDKIWNQLISGKQDYELLKPIKRIQKEVETYDFTMENEDAPFIIANGLVIHNCIGKKDQEKIKEYEQKIKDVAAKNGHKSELADLIWKIASDSAGYQFNKSHSHCYASLTAITIYLKANHPLQFYLALLQMAANEAAPHEVVQTIEKEMRINGFTLLPPHFLKSDTSFKIEGENSIRFALNLIRGISDKNMKHLKTFLEKNARDIAAGSSISKFSVFLALKNAGLNIGIGSALVQAGCMSGYDTYVDEKGQRYHSRSRLVLELNTWNQLTDTEKRLCLSIGDNPAVNWDVILALKYLAKQFNDKGKPLIKETRLATLRKKYKPYADIYEMNSRNERLANYFYEKKVLGYSYSETISSIFSEKIDGLKTISEIKDLPVDSHIKVIGFVADPAKGKTKKGNAEFKFRLLDETGEMRVKAFNTYIDQIEKHNGRLPVEEDLVIANCKKMSEDMLFVESGLDGVAVGIQTSRIYMKLSELRDSTTKRKNSLDAAPNSDKVGES